MIVTEVKVKSDSGKTYTIHLGGQHPRCTCPDYVYRSAVNPSHACKHMTYVASRIVAGATAVA